MITHKTTISLAGGLGNQLFQLAAGLNLSKNTQLAIDVTLGHPRTSINGVAEVLNFRLPNNVVVLNSRKISWLESKLGNLLLRISSRMKQNEKFCNSRSLMAVIVKKIFRLLFHPNENITIPKGVGFDKNLNFVNEDSLLIGYFQSYKWALDQNVKNVLNNLELLRDVPKLNEFKQLAVREQPIILHLRLGDYKEENKFGIPSIRYYEEATKLLWETGNYKKIWLFSDDPELARNMLPTWIIESGRWVDIDNGASSSNLEVMRCGSAYVISNSTFSWWGAYLSHTSNARVIAPKPWFKFMEEPAELLPKHWSRLQGWQ